MVPGKAVLWCRALPVVVTQTGSEWHHLMLSSCAHLQGQWWWALLQAPVQWVCSTTAIHAWWPRAAEQAGRWLLEPSRYWQRNTSFWLEASGLCPMENTEVGKTTETVNLLPSIRKSKFLLKTCFEMATFIKFNFFIASAPATRAERSLRKPWPGPCNVWLSLLSWGCCLAALLFVNCPPLFWDRWTC